ncbi:hypothetical protein [Nannocystis sp. SCPEA4]|uniref:hypothetical protein n=1 Tax=Nannocystis sp. SCPEA4 TaxID=2996787 RepID=UPI00226E3F88|nr:hypothetical protein [Nannocystis sp. SCPEA4]MCY1060414.1 hypothetical protein [Nannocystis sp. SCPEA4]
MPTKSFLALLLASLVSACAGKSNPPPADAPQACTKEAKVCPDGSIVGRTGPSCEFAPCPETAPAAETPASETPAEAATPPSP